MCVCVSLSHKVLVVVMPHVSQSVAVLSELFVAMGTNKGFNLKVNGGVMALAFPGVGELLEAERTRRGIEDDVLADVIVTTTCWVSPLLVKQDLLQKR